MAHKHTGQALVEFSLVCMILILLIIGFVDVMQIYGAGVAVENATRAAAHEAALRGNGDGIPFDRPVNLAQAGDGAVARSARTAISGNIFPLDAAATMITVSCDGTPCRRYAAMTVTMTYSGQVFFPMFGMGEIRVLRANQRAAEQDAQ